MGTSLHLPAPQFPYLSSGDNNNTHLTFSLLWEGNKIMHVEYNTWNMLGTWQMSAITIHHLTWLLHLGLRRTPTSHDAWGSNRILNVKKSFVNSWETKGNPGSLFSLLPLMLPHPFWPGRAGQGVGTTPTSIPTLRQNHFSITEHWQEDVLPAIHCQLGPAEWRTRLCQRPAEGINC